MTNRPILYSFRRCPYAMRARLAIASAQVNCALREIILRNKPAHMLEISPKGTVPVLQLPNGTVIDESLDIALWALETNDPENLLSPEKGNKAQMLALINEMDSAFKPLLDTYKYRFHSEPDIARAARDDALPFLQHLNSLLDAQDFLFGGRISLADMCILPFVRQFAFVDKEWFWAQDFTHVLAWLDMFLTSDRFATIMPKFPLWAPGDEEMAFPPVDMAS
ncbi:glutathione S-transferase [Maritalea porphyrae]|nr:glutathione S-transferase [Maritalea porphyrae]